MKLTAAIVVLLLLAAVLVIAARRRPSVSQAPAPPGTLVDELRRDVTALCAFGERSTFESANLNVAADWISREFAAAGHRVDRHVYRIEQDGVDAANVIAEIHGTANANEIVIIGAHYDSVHGTMGADDNASGVAVLLALARRVSGMKPTRTLRFVAFANEEPPHFQSEDMGSFQYAKRCHDRKERIVAMVSLESLGYFDDARGSQKYPPPLSALYPDTGNFIAFVSNIGSRSLNSRCAKAFRARSKFPIETASLPEAIPGIGWSDQWSFWQFGWPAIMISDTAPYRNPNYHEASDTPETLDYARMGQVVEGLSAVVEKLSGNAPLLK
ncbi:MAG TPA: M28 family peptidase [Thermoanaerobaculia bacterium]|jgi:Zn-dependent M28 family amino/carboxypeptidase|nr:M28 family peptidase [Thermoanaerobaculia bacterium]